MSPYAAGRQAAHRFFKAAARLSPEENEGREKAAMARRGLKEIRRAVSGGNLARADRLAKTPGVLNPANRAGSEIRDLGRGGEGLASLVAHPKHGLTVRKLYDPAAGVYSPKMIQRKEDLAPLSNEYARFARFHGAADTPVGTRMHFNEFIPNATAHKAPFGGVFDRVQRLAKKKGLDLHDVRPGNVVTDAAGLPKVIDFAPLRPQEAAASAREMWEAGRAHELRVKAERAGELFPPPSGVATVIRSTGADRSNAGLKRILLDPEAPLPAAEPAPRPTTMSQLMRAWRNMMGLPPTT